MYMTGTNPILTNQINMKLYKEIPDNTICVNDMKDGDIAIIRKWGISDYVGCIVQRYENNLIRLGENSGKGWSDVLNYRNENFRVEILPKGTLLEV